MNHLVKLMRTLRNCCHRYTDFDEFISMKTKGKEIKM